MDNKLNEVEANEVTERDNLAVVYRVERLEAIPNKDNIELVHMAQCGFTAVCQKGHQVGDLVLFVKYDSILPQNELFEFMKEFKYRVKAKSFTIRNEFDTVVGKIYSQGIVLPLQKVINFLLTQNTTQYEQLAENVGALEGQDATEILQVKKYIPPSSGSMGSMGNMQSKGDFPTHLLSKTDEMNLASKMRVLEELKGKKVYITMKIEGSSLSVVPEEGEVNVCSRNNKLVENETNKFWSVVKRYNLDNKMKSTPSIGLQAELYGEGVQKNKLGIKGNDMAVFNVINLQTRTLEGLEEMKTTCAVLGVPMVPLCAVIENFDWSFDKLQEYADIQKYENGELAEGIVVRPVVPEYSRVLGTWLSVKVINREYKL
jgi:RNA ligase (TIGR02306 family)